MASLINSPNSFGDLLPPNFSIDFNLGMNVSSCYDMFVDKPVKALFNVFFHSSLFSIIFISSSSILILMFQSLKKKIFAFLFSSLILIGHINLCSGEEHLVVRIVDAEYPPNVRIYENGNYTLFSFDVDLQIENPTESTFNFTFVCTPIPFPHLESDLINKSLETETTVLYEWVAGEGLIPPGTKNQSYDFTILITNYENEQLPSGEYTLWFDYTFCSYVSIPVITEKMHIIVSESNITYFFEYNNNTKTFTIEKTNYTLWFSISSIFLLVVGFRFLKSTKCKERNEKD